MTLLSGVFEPENSHATIAHMSRETPLPTDDDGPLSGMRTELRRFVDLWPITALGLALAFVGAVALFGFGYAKLDLVLLVVGYGVLGLLCISVIAVVVTSFIVRVPLRRASKQWLTSRFETGRPSPTGFVLPAFGWMPLARVRWRWVSPDGAEASIDRSAGKDRESVSFASRGIFDGVRRQIVIEDAFGLARVAFHDVQEGPLEVMPHRGAIRGLPVLTSLTGGEDYPHPMGLEDGDRVEMRRYTPGDPARFIHWKAFSRTRKLMVRMPERSLSRARRTVAFLVAGPDDEASAGAARAVIEAAALGADWQFGTDGSPTPTSSAEEAVNKVMKSGGFRGLPGSGLRPFVSEVDREGPAALIVFAPPTPGPWLGEVASLSRRRVGGIRVVIGVDAVFAVSDSPRWKRFLFSPRARRGVSRNDLEKVGQTLGPLPCEVLVIDRVSGRVLGDGARAAVAAGRAA